MAPHEEILSLEEIEQILSEAKDSRYSDPYTFHLGSNNKLSILTLSRISGLIMINGNDRIGYNHICLRHSLQSRKAYWVNEGKLENPSKFPLSLAPIDYLNLASQIFNSQFKNILENKSPDIFDLYIGNCNYYKLETEYKLLTYKGTGIIHTFYVSKNNKPYNNKKILDLKREEVRYKNDVISNIHSFQIPYSDQNNIECFKIIIEYTEFNKIERWYIQKNMKDGKTLLTLIKETMFEHNIEVPLLMNYFNSHDISWAEKNIKQILSKSDNI